jgi:Fic family protein
VRAFIPPGLPPNPPVELAGLYQHLDRANQALGRLDGLTTLLPDTKFFLYLYIQKEALLSSQIEGRNLRFRIYCCLKVTLNPAFRLTMLRKSRTTSRRCNMDFVG